MFKDFEKKGPEKLSDYREFEFENGVRLIHRTIEGEPSFRLIDKNGKDLVDLASFAPAGTRLEMNKKKDDKGRLKWEADTDNAGFVILVGEYFSGVEALLSFLHEAGHLHNSFDHDLIVGAERRHLVERKKDATNAYPSSRLWAMKEEKDIVMRSERDAWSFAFRKAIELEKKFQISIFDRLEGQGKAYERARRFANDNLGTHEKIYLDELYNLDIFSTKQMEDFFDSLEEEGAV